MSNLKESHDIILQLVKESIDELAAHFLKNPYFFYTENDLHCHLFNIIFKKFESHELNKPIETSDGKSSILLHKEYPTKAQYRRNEAGKLQKVEKGRKGRRGHFDLSVWNPDLVNERLFRSEGGKGEQETFIAIELALVENNYQAKDALIHTKNDLLKLSDSENNVEYGFMLFFVREWDNRDEFKLIAKKQLTLKEKPTSYYIETKKELLNDFLNKP